jgi:hypothetical protein
MCTVVKAPLYLENKAVGYCGSRARFLATAMGSRNCTILLLVCLLYVSNLICRRDCEHMRTHSCLRLYVCMCMLQIVYILVDSSSRCDMIEN